MFWPDSIYESGQNIQTDNNQLRYKVKQEENRTLTMMDDPNPNPFFRTASVAMKLNRHLK